MPSINMIAVRREDKRRQEQNIRKLLYAILGRDRPSPCGHFSDAGPRFW